MQTTYIFVAAVAFCIAYAINNAYLRVLDSRKAKNLGCGTLVSDSRSGWTGIPMLLRMNKAGKELRFVNFSHDQFDRLSKEHGRPVTTFHHRLGLFRDVIMTSDPQNIKAIFATQTDDFNLGEIRRKVLEPVLGDGIFTAEGKKWEHSRALGRRQFSRANVSNLQIEEDHVQALMAVLDKSLKADGWTSKVDLMPLFFKLTMDSATEFLFGQSTNSQSDGDSARYGGLNGVDFADAVEEAGISTTVALRLGKLYWLAFTKRFRRNVDVIKSFSNQFVLKALASDVKEGPAKDDFLQALVKETRDPDEIRNELLSLLFAGRDTTACSLSWFFHIMARHPKIYHRLRTIVLDEFGPYSSPKTITYESLKSCRYLQWCINEVLRLHSVVQFAGRAAAKDTTLPTGGGPDGKSPIFVKKDQPVVSAIGNMHIRKHIWGEDADEYKPERWENRKQGWDYVPFSGGPRVCIGQQFALTETAYVALRLIQRIDKIDASELGPITHRTLLVDMPGNGVNLRLHFVD